jgi:hypothetical protein
MPLRTTDTAKTSMDSLTKNEVADMNSSYLKQKPGQELFLGTSVFLPSCNQASAK